MKQLPDPKIYEKEFKYMPWGVLIRDVLRLVLRVRKESKVLDLMCGPGYLLSKIHEKRKDLFLTGVDIDSRYIRYARRKYKGIDFVKADSLKWQSRAKFDLVLCTAGLHHLPYAQHEKFIRKISNLLAPEGFCILADPYVAKYSNEKQRKLAAAELGFNYLKATIENNSSDDVIAATIDILFNDVLPKGEYKTFIDRVKKFAKKYFGDVKVVKTWPKFKSNYGDYYLILRKPL